jgi:hypothetical protein
MQVEASTQEISRDVASVHKDVTAILNLLMHPSKVHDQEQSPTANGSQTKASHTLAQARDSAVKVQPLPVPRSQQAVFSSALAALEPKIPAVVEPKPPFKEYSLSAQDATATATIVLLADSTDGASKVPLLTDTQGAAEGGNESSGGGGGPLGVGVPAATTSRNGGSVTVWIGDPADSETLHRNSTTDSLERFPTPRQAFVSAPLAARLKQQAADAAAEQAPGAWVVTDAPGRGPSWSPGSNMNSQARQSSCAPGGEGGAGDRELGGLRSSWVTVDQGGGSGGVRSPQSSETLLSRSELLQVWSRSGLGQDGQPADWSQMWASSREGSAALLDEATDGGTPQSRRSCKGRWAGSVRRRGSSCDETSAGPELGCQSPR